MKTESSHFSLARKVEQGSAVRVARIGRGEAALDTLRAASARSEREGSRGRITRELSQVGKGKFHVFCVSAYLTLENVHYQKSEMAVLNQGDRGRDAATLGFEPCAETFQKSSFPG